MMEKEYIRLPGRGQKKKGMFGFTRLYLGKDHLLCLYNSAYTEDYRRFYFRDIQAIVIAVNSRREKLSAAYGAAALLLLLMAFLKGGYWAAFFMILSFLFLVNVAINWHRGPTCSCRLYTAASKEDLPSLRRVKNAMAVIEMINPLIEQHQGRLSPGDIRPMAPGQDKQSAPGSS